MVELADKALYQFIEEHCEPLNSTKQHDSVTQAKLISAKVMTDYCIPLETVVMLVPPASSPRCPKH
jgi:hypothetical protein